MPENGAIEGDAAMRPPAAVGRRRVLDWLLGLSSGSLLGALAYPALRFMVPPERAEEAAASVVVAKADEIAPNSGRIVRFGSRPAILLRLPSGEFRAFSAVCTHLDCTVQYRADQEVIWCACHNGRFDLAGRNVSGPPPRPLESFDVAVRDGDVVVSRRA